MTTFRYVVQKWTGIIKGMAVRLRRHADGTVRAGCALVLVPHGQHTLHIKSLQQTTTASGAELLAATEAYARAHGFRRLTLQDASHVRCDDGSSLDLGLRSRLLHGHTWYERHGFEMPRRFLALRARADAALAAVAGTLVVDLANTVALQNGLLARGARYEPVRGVLSRRSVGPAPQRSRAWVLRHRIELHASLVRAWPGARLGEWLAERSCAEFARFIWATYGDMYNGASPALSRVSGVKTLTVKEFRTASWPWRNTGRILWVKDLMDGNKNGCGPVQSVTEPRAHHGRA